MLTRLTHLALIALIALTFAAGGAAAQESGTPEAVRPVPAQYYELSGPGLTVTIEAPAIADVLPTLHIEYTAVSEAGSDGTPAASPEPFTYDGPPEQMQEFPGPGGNGWLLTVMVEVMFDAQTTTLSVLMPAVNLTGESASIDTVAILTTHLTSFAGPAMVTGPIQLYQIVPLSGTARQSRP